LQVGAGVLAVLSLLALWWAGVIRPGAFRGRARDPSAMPWWGWVGAAMAMYAAQSVGAVLGLGIARASGLAADDAGDQTLPGQALTAAGAYVVSVAAGALLIHVLVRDRGDRARAAAGLRFGVADVFAGLAWFLLTCPVVFVALNGSALVLEWLSGESPGAIAHETLQTLVDSRGDPWAWLLAACAVIGAPITEELTYRVFLQSGLLALFRRTWAAILTTSVLFGAVHAGVADWHALPGLFFFGLALGIAYERSRSPLVPITMHALFNGAMVALAMATA
jgi:membrane protease YdiL (CAAX protease family)